MYEIAENSIKPPLGVREAWKAGGITAHICTGMEAKEYFTPDMFKETVWFTLATFTCAYIAFNKLSVGSFDSLMNVAIR